MLSLLKLTLGIVERSILVIACSSGFRNSVLDIFLPVTNIKITIQCFQHQHEMV